MSISDTARDTLQNGTILIATYKGQECRALVADSSDKLNITLLAPDAFRGQGFSSLSKAAMAITGNSVNGWRFWTIEGKVDTEVDTRKVAKQATAKAVADFSVGKVAILTETVDMSDVDEVAGIAEPSAESDPGFGNGGVFTADAKRPARKRSFSPIKRTAQQGGLEPGITRMWCHGCQASFTTALDPESFKADNERCPSGHIVGAMREAVMAATGED